LITAVEREKRYDQKAQTIWITGLHGSGKNELAYSLERELFDMGKTVIVLDGKSIRSGLSRELDYSPADRAEHLRRVAHICRLLNQQGIIVICSFISPNESIRKQIQEIVGEDKFKLVYLNADLEFCRNNDNYGIYELADKGEIHNIAGIDLNYGKPENPDLALSTENKEKNTEALLDFAVKFFELNS
jgi:bifunctional enzyme CysN/CysC